MQSAQIKGVSIYIFPGNGKDSILISVFDSAMGECRVEHAIRTIPGVFMTRTVINVGVLL